MWNKLRQLLNKYRDLVLYLISDKAAFITGETIMIDGGRNAMSHW